jgi:hypothetical protein
MHVYLRTYQRKRSPVPFRLCGGTGGISQYKYVYTPARESPDGRSHLRYVAEQDPILYMMGLVQRSERKKQRAQQLEEKRLRQLEKASQGGRMGRPRKHLDRELLAYLGAYRRGPRIVLSRAMPTEERARRRYTLLSAEWRERLTVDEFVLLEQRVVSMRKRANKFGQEWDAGRAYADALQEIMAARGTLPAEQGDDT